MDAVARGFLWFLLYLVGSAGFIALLDRWGRWPKEVIRKLYHLMITFSMLFLVFAFPHWWGAVISLWGLMLVAYLVIKIGSYLPMFRDLSIRRRRQPGEVTRQIGFLALSFGGLLVVFWGFLGEEWKFVAILAAMIWGFGDAAAALVGKLVGRRKLKEPVFDGNKTVEGSLANFGASFLISFAVLMVFTTTSWWIALVASLLLAAASAVLEAVSRHGRDTIIVPWAMAALAYPVLAFLTYLEKWWNLR